MSDQKPKKIIHEDERIIEILAMFAEEIKTGRVRDGEAIDKTACMLTAYMEGMVKGKWNTRAPDPMLEELAGALEEIARCLSHGLQDCRASVIAKDMLGKYQQPKVQL